MENLVAPEDEVEGSTQPDAVVPETQGSVAALAHVGLAGARTLFAVRFSRARSDELIETVATGLEKAVAVGKDVTPKAGSIIKDTAQDPETQELVFKGATIAAREVGLLFGGTIGGRIVERIGKVVGDRLLHRTVAADTVAGAPPQATVVLDENEDRTG